MNREQRKYLFDRIVAITQDKRIALEKKHVIPAKRLDSSQRVELIVAGKVPMKDVVAMIKNYKHTALIDCFDFSEYEHASYVNDEVGWQAATTRLLDESRRVKDEIMLGDSAQALAMLKAFEEFTV